MDVPGGLPVPDVAAEGRAATVTFITELASLITEAGTFQLTEAPALLGQLSNPAFNC